MPEHTNDGGENAVFRPAVDAGDLKTSPVELSSNERQQNKLIKTFATGDSGYFWDAQVDVSD